LLIAEVCVPAEISVEDHELLARVAHRSYVEGRTQEAIAGELGMSRPKVQRLLERARAVGVVDIRIQAPPGLNLELESRLVQTFDLADAIVSTLPADADPADVDGRRAAVAQAAARYLERRLRDGTTVAVSHGRTNGEIPRYFRPARRLGCVFASAMGGSPHVDTPTNPNDICRSLAERCGGRAESLYAPVYVESADVRDQLLAQDAISHTIDVAARADVALVGVGGTDPNCTMVRSGCLSVAEIAALRDDGAVGDILGTYVDIDGRRVDGAHTDRIVALPIEDLRRIDTVIAVVSEPEKPRAVFGALHSGVIDVLIIDEDNARAVLDLAADALPHPPSRGGR
jgi:DNA-binding transcriptional regulator LsrR (DeoR family)